MNNIKFKKAVQTLNFFAKKEGGTLNYMKAIKLIWLSDRLHVRKYGRTITNDTYLAMKNGLVPSGVKDIVLKSGFFEEEAKDYSNEYLSVPEDYKFNSLKEVDTSVFSKTDLSIMEEIYNTYGDKDEFKLSDYSHLFPEWKRFEHQLNTGVAKRFPIIEDDFFETSKEKVFSQSEELLNLSKEHFYELA